MFMNIVLLSGGSGSRLWPVSTEDCPKQFLSFFDDKRSMLEKTYQYVGKVSSNIFIATQQKFKKKIEEQLNNKVNFIIEPKKIGTFGAILNAGVYLKYERKLSDDDFVSIVPIDHDVDSKFYELLLDAEKLLISKKLNICLIGIKPTNPSTQFGYILKKNDIVEKFCEKPNEENAKIFIEQKALWNSGIVVFKLKYIVELSKKYINYETYEEFLKKYEKLPNNSFDKEFLEKEKNICLLETNLSWNDLGTWEVMSEKISKKDQYNTNIINFEDKKIKNKGIKDSIIVNSKNGLLLLNKNSDKLYWKDWGYYKILDYYKNKDNEIKIKILNIDSGNNLSYQYHNFRCEEWFVLSGSGKAIIENEIIQINSGDKITILEKQLHTIKAEKDLCIIEIQYGKKADENDIVRIEKDWNKIISIVKIN